MNAFVTAAPVVWCLFNVALTATSPTLTAKAPAGRVRGSAATNGSLAGNGTSVTHGENAMNFNVDGNMIQRALYVLIGITMIGVLYFLVRAVRLKKTPQRKKYGLLSNYDDSVEMGALNSDDDDTTVYEAKSLRR
ncbi:protein FAM174C [Denticeps clupeoides]|uniref:Uncharacterized protein n=1 Tax=Denticeps clupeoides TaxID=299321 RepID=A0AAY4ETC0_9TELE|nr:uncharacterized membrane protein C19orf24 homolog [Denticeps clupeoides]